MIDIRYNKKYSKKIEKLYNASQLKNEITINLDNNIEDVIIVVPSNGSFVNWSYGFENAKSFLEKGYVDIRKFCPLLHKKCIGEKCAFNYLKNNTRDCAIIWNLIRE